MTASTDKTFTSATPELQALQPTDVQGGLALSREARWNQTAKDWTYMLTHGSGWKYVQDAGAPPIATAQTLPYGNRFAWICMVLVTQRWRRRGLATRLLQIAVEDLLSKDLVPGLDATPGGREVYLPLGFEDVYGLTRLAAKDVKIPSPKLDPEVQSLSASNIPEIGDLDCNAFGADRRDLLGHLQSRAPAWARITSTGAGHVFARDGHHATQLGPLVATDHEVAIRLAATALSKIGGAVFVDVPNHQQQFRNYLFSKGFEPQRQFLRMLHNREEPVDDPSKVFAVAGPEFG